MSYVHRAVAQAIEHQGVAHAFHEIRIVVRGRAVDAKADDSACRFQFSGTALARRENHVRCGAMANADFVAAQALDFRLGEMDAVCKPGAFGEPFDAFEVVERAAAETRQAIIVFVAGFGEVRVQLAIETSGHARGGHHNFLGDHERGAGREGHLAKRAFGWIVKARESVLAGCEGGIFGLDESVVGEAAVRGSEINGAARQCHAHTERGRFGVFDVEDVFHAGRKQKMMVACGGAAGHEQFGERETDSKAENVEIEMARPDRIERLEPAEKFLVDGARMGAREILIEMVMRVDQSGKNDVARGVECFIARSGRTGGADKFGDAAVFDDQSAGLNCGHRRRGKQSDSVLYIEAHGALPFCAAD